MFPVIAFVGAYLGVSWLGKAIVTSVTGAKMASDHMKKKAFERDALLDLNFTRARMDGEPIEILLVDWTDIEFPMGMQEWAREFVITSKEYLQLQQAATNRRRELEEPGYVPVVPPLGVLREFAHLSDLRRVDQGVQALLQQN